MATVNAINLQQAGLTSYDGSGTFNGRTLTPPIAGITISNASGIAGNPTFALANDLAAVEGLSTTGIATRTAASVWTTRTITAGSGISISNGDGVAGDPTITAGATIPTTFTADSGSATPAANNLNVLGSGSITTSGAGSTITTALTGLTNHAVLVGAGTATITKVGPTATAGQVFQSAGAAADPAFSTATYPSIATGTGTILRADGTNWVATTATYPATTTINQLLYSSANNVIGGLTAANQSVLTSTTTGVPAWVSMATDGKVLIGSTAGNPAAATLTAGTGITITNGSNAITIAANGSVVAQTLTGDSGGSLSPSSGNFNILGGPGVTTSGSGSTLTINSIVFTDTTATTLAVDNGYFATAAGTYNMPATAAQGETVIVFCDTSGAVVLDCPASNFIRIGNQITSSGGTVTSTAQGNSLTLKYRLSTLTWCSISSTGNWTIA